MVARPKGPPDCNDRPAPGQALGLGNDLVNRLGAFHADQALIQPPVKVAQLVRVEAKLLENGGMQMLDVEWFLDRGTAQLICLANTNPTLDAAASHPHGEAVTIMITPCALGILSGGLTPEFTSPNNQRFIEHTALFEILQQAGDGLVCVPGLCLSIVPDQI